MSALARVVRAGVTRRRLQTAVVVLTTLMAVAAAVLATGVLVASRAPFDRVMAQEHGAHLTASFDASKVTPEQLGKTARTPGVTAAAGPFRTVTARPRVTSYPREQQPPGAPAPPPEPVPVPAGTTLHEMTVAGRRDSQGPVDRLALLEGAWAERAGEIVLADDGPFLPVGTRLDLPGLPGDPKLTVVGVARSVTGTADAWVTPAQATALTPDTGASKAASRTRPAAGHHALDASGAPGTPGAARATAGYEMLYRFAQAETTGQLSAHRAALDAAVPAGALTGTLSHLTVRQEQQADALAFVPFVAAFGVLGLAMSVLIIGIVVSGAVGAATRRIGVLKSLGCTPGQVVRAYVAQAMVPAVLGCALGVVLGNLLAGPALGEVDEVYGGGRASVPVWVDLVVPGAALLLVAGAALLPALRAGRLDTVRAIGTGRTPAATRGRLARRITRRLPLPRPVSLGLANPFAHPARSATTAAAVVLAAVTVTFGVGLAQSLAHVQTDRTLDPAGALVVETGRGDGPPGARAVHDPGAADEPPADPAEVAAVLRDRQGTGRFYGTTTAEVTTSGLTGRTSVLAYRGDTAWGAPKTVAGHWLTAPHHHEGVGGTRTGQAVVTHRFLRTAGVSLGDTLTLTAGGRHASVRLVGEAFFTENQGMTLLTSTSTLTALGLDATPTRFYVQPGSGTGADRLSALNAALHGTGAFAHAGDPHRSDVIAAMDALVGLLTLMLVAVAVLGVLNTVVLDTRERVHDLGVFKALGMTPRQTVTMVITSIATIGLVAGVAGVPLGVLLHHRVTPLMGDAVGLTVPHSDITVYATPVLALLALGGLVIAVAGALLPAGWAAGTDTARALRTE